MYKFSYTLSEEEYYEFNIYSYLNKPAGKRSFLIFRFLVPLILVASVVFTMVVIGEIYFGAFDYIFLAIAVLWIIFAKKFYIRSIRGSVKKLISKGKAPYGIPTEMVFEEDFFKETTPENENKSKYSSVESVAVGPEAVYIYLNAILAYIIPNRVFQNDNEKIEFVEFINSKIQ